MVAVDALVHGAGGSKQTVQVTSLDCETNDTGIFYDPNNYLRGDVHYRLPYTSQTAGTDSLGSGTPVVNGCSNLSLWNMDTGACYGATCPVFTQAVTASPTSGLVSYWPATDGSGATEADTVGTNPMTITGYTWASNTVFGTAPTFSGSSSGGTSSNTGLNFSTTTPFSYTIQLAPSSLGASGTQKTLVGNLYGAGSQGYSFHLLATGALQLQLINSTSAPNYLVCITGSGVVTTGSVQTISFHL